MDDSGAGYSVNEAAAILAIAPATLRFWEQTFRDELAVPRDDRGEIRFSDKHIDAISRIQRLVLEDGVSLDDAKHAMRSAPKAESTKSPAEEPDESNDAAPTPPTRAPEPSAPGVVETQLTSHPHQAKLDAVVAGLADTLQEMARLIGKLQADILKYGDELARVNEEIRYIVEENSALQGLVARLVERVDELGASSTNAVVANGGPVQTPHRELPHSEGSKDEGRVLASSALQGPQPQIRAWRPEDLGPIAARSDYAGAYLN